MTFPWIILILAGVGGAVYFATTYISTRRQISRLPRVEQAAILIEEATIARERPTRRQRIHSYVARRGWDGNLAPLVFFAVFGIFATATVMSLMKVPPMIALAASIPVVGLSLFAVDGYINDRRARKFHRQMIQVLELLKTDVESGVSPGQALSRIPLSLSEPARSEFLAAADRRRLDTNMHLDESVAPIAERYPSRAMSLLVAALRIDRERGASIAPALQQAHDTLQRDIELTEETAAEIAQTKFEFLIIVGVFAFIIFTLVFNSGHRDVFFSTFLGITGLIIVAINVSFGIWRAFRMISRIQRVGG